MPKRQQEGQHAPLACWPVLSLVHRMQCNGFLFKAAASLRHRQRSSGGGLVWDAVQTDGVAVDTRANVHDGLPNRQRTAVRRRQGLSASLRRTRTPTVRLLGPSAHLAGRQPARQSSSVHRYRSASCSVPPPCRFLPPSRQKSQPFLHGLPVATHPSRVLQQ